VDGQINVASKAAARGGIQPTIEVMVNGKKRVDINADQSVVLKAVIQIPAGQGKLVDAAWDFDGSGLFKDAVNLAEAKISNDGLQVEFSTTRVFNKSGIYFPVLRLASQRNSDTKTPYTRIQNLDRVRVVVQ
jgi:hypothetical protein